MSNPLVDCHELSCGYQADVPVVRSIDLKVNEGEIVALLGANGAGKTTTLLTLAALMPPLSGRSDVLRQRLGRTNTRALVRGGLAYVPEERALFFELTVAENLKLGGKPGRGQVDYVVGLFPALEPLLNRRAGLLSGGEQQMLALGRALQARPRLLFIDEMTLGLAPIIAESLVQVLRDIARQHGTAILLVEQHVRLALEAADRAYVLTNGVITMTGSSAEFARNTDLITSSYLGGPT